MDRENQREHSECNQVDALPGTTGFSRIEDGKFAAAASLRLQVALGYRTLVKQEGNLLLLTTIGF